MQKDHSRPIIRLLCFKPTWWRRHSPRWFDLSSHEHPRYRVNVSSVTGYRPTVPSWSGEARHVAVSYPHLSLLDSPLYDFVAKEQDPRVVLRDAYGLSTSVSNAIARHLEEHTIDTFQVPEPNRILIEQIIGTDTLHTSSQPVEVVRSIQPWLLHGRYCGNIWCQRHRVVLRGKWPVNTNGPRGRSRAAVRCIPLKQPH